MFDRKSGSLMLEASESKVARLVLESQELFYFVSSLTMLKRHCDSFEDAQRIVANTGVSQVVVKA